MLNKSSAMAILSCLTSAAALQSNPRVHHSALDYGALMVWSGIVISKVRWVQARFWGRRMSSPPIGMLSAHHKPIAWNSYSTFYTLVSKRDTTASPSRTCPLLIPLLPHLCVIVITHHFTLIALLLHLLLALPRPCAQDLCQRYSDCPPSLPQASKWQRMPSLVTLFLCFKHLHFLFPFLFHIADKQNEYQMFSGYIAMWDYCWLHSFILFSLLYSQIVHSILVLIAPAPTYKNHHPTLLKGRQLWCIFPISLACPLLSCFLFDWLWTRNVGVAIEVICKSIHFLLSLLSNIPSRSFRDQVYLPPPFCSIAHPHFGYNAGSISSLLPWTQGHRLTVSITLPLPLPHLVDISRNSLTSVLTHWHPRFSCFHHSLVLPSLSTITCHHLILSTSQGTH